MESSAAGPSGASAPRPNVGNAAQWSRPPNPSHATPTPTSHTPSSRALRPQPSQRALRLAAIIEASRQTGDAASSSATPGSKQLGTFKRAASPPIFPSPTPSTPQPTSKRARMTGSPTSPVTREARGRVRNLLENLEEDLNCPICCDLLILAHVTNPCGHTCCAECGFTWIMKSKRAPTCAVCRTVVQPPLIPNLVLDNIIDRHIESLAANGASEWAPGGTRHVERSERKRRWLSERAKIERTAAQRRQVVLNIIDEGGEARIVIPDPDAASDGSYESSGDEDEESAESLEPEVDAGPSHIGRDGGGRGQSRQPTSRRTRRRNRG